MICDGAFSVPETFAEEARAEGEEGTQRIQARPAIIVKLSNGRIEEARVNHVLQDSDSTKMQVDFGHDETALIEL